jgi:hypothetical protein
MGGSAGPYGGMGGSAGPYGGPMGPGAGGPYNPSFSGPPGGYAAMGGAGSPSEPAPTVSDFQVTVKVSTVAKKS